MCLSISQVSIANARYSLGCEKEGTCVMREMENVKHRHHTTASCACDNHRSPHTHHNQVTCQRLSLIFQVSRLNGSWQMCSIWTTTSRAYDNHRWPHAPQPGDLPEAVTILTVYLPWYQGERCPEKYAQYGRPHHVPATTTGDHNQVTRGLCPSPPPAPSIMPLHWKGSCVAYKTPVPLCTHANSIIIIFTNINTFMNWRSCFLVGGKGPDRLLRRSLIRRVDGVIITR